MSTTPASITREHSAEESLEAADAAIARMDVEAAVRHLSDAVRILTTAGETRLAALAGARLGDLMATGLGNLTAARAWYTRARRLVDGEPPCVEQGWVAIAALGCDVDDPDALLTAAELALDRSRHFGDVNLETKALADAGLAHVQAGRHDEGMAMLDEAMALACGPADDVGSAAKSVCSFFTACYYAAEFDRASSWAALLRTRGLIGDAGRSELFVSSHCDSVQATLLMELGHWDEAEAVLTASKARFEAALGAPSWHPDIALADLRIRQGRLVEAEALLLGKDHHLQALLPAARLHLAGGDYTLAEAVARRGLRALGSDRLRVVELTMVLAEAALARGAVQEATELCDQVAALVEDLSDDHPLKARFGVVAAQVRAAGDDLAGAVSLLEATADAIDAERLPWLRAVLLVELARLRDAAGDAVGATVDATLAARTLEGLDVVVPVRDSELIARLCGRAERQGGGGAELSFDGKCWVVSCGAGSERLRATKGLRYLAELVAHPGTERHVLDLVDLVEGIDADGPDRRALGDAGDVIDAQARRAYRHRIEQLRSVADDALAAGRLESAEAAQAEIDTLLAQLAQAFGLGGRSRKSSSAAERARLNVTRALRAATSRITEALPDAGAALDRRIRTGTYCSYEPDPDDTIAWRVVSPVR